ncbi:MAG TPA: chemotaxis protein CheW [Candidatus Acidoferrales bacterium]|nr:chemotaxis protein CheW [Candidatus Acidoferrales bacterium]
MSATSEEVQLRSFVLVQVGKRKVALAADAVIELVAPTKEQNIPHRTPWLSGVIVRRGRIVPVCDVGNLIGEEPASQNSFHLIAESKSSGKRDWYAIPVAGECVLLTPESTLPAEGHAEYVSEMLPLGEDRIEVLDLLKLIQRQEAAFVEGSQEADS